MNAVQITLLVIIIILAVILLLIILAGVGFVCLCKSTDNLSYPYYYHIRGNHLTNSERHRILYDMFDVFQRYTQEITTWPTYGTLLGFIREGKIICYDYDLDFGIFGNDWDKLKVILDKIAIENPEYGYMWYDFPFMRFAQLYHRKTMVNCDIAVYKIKSGKVVRVLWVDKHKYDVTDSFPLKSMTVKHYYKDIKYDIKVPACPEKILETCYGKNYMTPDHRCDDACENCIKLS